MAVRDAKRVLGSRFDELHALGMRIFGAQQLQAMPQFGASERWLVATLVTGPAGDPPLCGLAAGLISPGTPATRRRLAGAQRPTSGGIFGTPFGKLGTCWGAVERPNIGVPSLR